MDLAYMCAKHQMRLYVCQALPPPKHQMCCMCVTKCVYTIKDGLGRGQGLTLCYVLRFGRGSECAQLNHVQRFGGGGGEGWGSDKKNVTPPQTVERGSTVREL